MRPFVVVTGKSKSNTNMHSTVSVSALEGQVYVLFVREVFRMN